MDVTTNTLASPLQCEGQVRGTMEFGYDFEGYVLVHDVNVSWRGKREEELGQNISSLLLDSVVEIEV